ncbi:MAG: DNA repair protein RecO [Longimicrobiales bacterium]
MPLLSDEVLILQAFAYSETSKILRLLTREHGLVSVIARGALRPKSRYGGQLEAFSEGVAVFYTKPTRELQTLSGFDLINSGQALGRDLIRFGGAALLAELVVLTGSEEPEPAIFGHVRSALRNLARAAQPELEPMVLTEVWRLIALLGYAPALGECLHCERGLDPAEDAVFDYAAGGVRCSRCPAPPAGRSLPASGRRTLQSMLAGQPMALQRTAAHWALLGRFLTYHLADGRQLRSLEFLNAVLPESHV